MNLAAVLLAAGGSTRLGSPKQLLTYRGRSLLRHAAETLLAVPCNPVAVVLGARAATLRRELIGLDVLPVLNPAWGQGMGGSVRAGMLELEKAAAPDAVLLTLCDQPLVGVEALRRMAAAFAQAQGMDAIVAAGYNDTVGVPVLFGRAYLDALRSLPLDAGARPLLRKHAAKVVAVPLPEAAVDIDTREQYARLLGAEV